MLGRAAVDADRHQGGGAPLDGLTVRDVGRIAAAEAHPGRAVVVS